VKHAHHLWYASIDNARTSYEKAFLRVNHEKFSLVWTHEKVKFFTKMKSFTWINFNGKINYNDCCWWVILEEEEEKYQRNENSICIMHRILRNTQDLFDISEKRFKDIQVIILIITIVLNLRLSINVIMCIHYYIIILVSKYFIINKRYY